MTLQKIIAHSRSIIVIGIIIIASYFLAISLMSAKKVMAPVITALVLALLVTPLSRKMEMAGFHKLLATVTIFLRHIPDLEAFAYLLSNDEEEP